MTQSTERYRFHCRCGEQFVKESRPPAPTLNLLLTVVTLGGWLVIWAIQQWIWIYCLSRCPECGRGARRLIVILLVLVLVSVDIVGSYYYLMYVAPGDIAARTASPEPLSVRENSILYLTLAAKQYGVYVLVGWFLVFSIILLSLPNRFQSR